MIVLLTEEPSMKECLEKLSFPNCAPGLVPDERDGLAGAVVSEAKTELALTEVTGKSQFR